MQLDSIKGVIITLAFLVPGYVWSTTLSSFISRKRRDPALVLLEFFTLSCVNDSLWLLLYLGFKPAHYLSSHPFLMAILSFAALFVSPFFFGLIVGGLSSIPNVGSALRLLGWLRFRAVSTAWDYWFASKQAAFISVTMTNGSQVHGYFGPRSYAGDGTDEERDIYIERVYAGGSAKHAGGLRLVDRTAGILINREQIAYIEFYTPE